MGSFFSTKRGAQEGEEEMKTGMAVDHAHTGFQCLAPCTTWWPFQSQLQVVDEDIRTGVLRILMISSVGPGALVRIWLRYLAQAVVGHAARTLTPI